MLLVAAPTGTASPRSGLGSGLGLRRVECAGWAAMTQVATLPGAGTAETGGQDRRRRGGRR